MLRRLAILAATGFGLGRSPVAPGTVGSLPGVAIAVALAALDLPWQIAACVLLTVAAVPICGLAETACGRKDDGSIVADEYLTFPVCVLGLRWMERPWLLAVAFVTARVFDVLKPPPARQSQALRGGLGIVADDVLANLYALAANHAVAWLAARFAGV